MEKDVKKGERKGKLRAKRFNNGETKIKQMQNGENTGTKENISVFISGCHEDEISSLDRFFRTKRYRKTFGNMGNRLDCIFTVLSFFDFLFIAFSFYRVFSCAETFVHVLLALYNAQVFKSFLLLLCSFPDSFVLLIVFCFTFNLLSILSL
jgi:hypothetical protein